MGTCWDKADEVDRSQVYYTLQISYTNFWTLGVNSAQYGAPMCTPSAGPIVHALTRTADWNSAATTRLPDRGVCTPRLPAHAGIACKRPKARACRGNRH